MPAIKHQNKVLQNKRQSCSNTKKYHVFAPMGRFQLELIYLYETTVENKSKLILKVVVHYSIYTKKNSFDIHVQSSIPS